MATNQVTIIKENSSGDFQELKVTAEANKAIGFDTNLNPVMVSVSSNSLTVNTSLTSLVIDCSLANIFIISINANSNFSLSNVTALKEYTFIVKNTSAGAITVTMPNSEVYVSQSVDISTGKARMFGLVNINSKNYWLVSGELSNV